MVDRSVNFFFFSFTSNNVQTSPHMKEHAESKRAIVKKKIAIVLVV